MLLFTKAAQKLKISTLGFIQFISPSIQFLLAAFIFNEIMSTYKWISFIIIWCACFLIAYASLSGKKIYER
jgi:chloramphenicol-sensitive protein RarD